MKLEINSLDGSIKTIRELQKDVCIYIYKDGVNLIKFTCNKIDTNGINFHFYYNYSLPISVNYELIKGKLKFDFASEHTKFYKLNI